MSLTAQAGIWGFTPQNKKSTHASYTPPTTWYRHKADAVTMGILDDQRMGDPEVGGRPVPGYAYKAGAIVGGGAVITPRLENTFGWLLYAALGDVVAAADAPDPDAVHGPQVLGVATTVVNSGITKAATAEKVIVGVMALGAANAAFTGGVEIVGTDGADAPLTETVTLTGKGLEEYAESVGLFKTITQITYPAREVAGDALGVGVYSGQDHVFKLSSTVPSYVPWFAQRKYIPPMDGDLATDLGETYIDCKATGLMFTLPNEGLVKARLDTRGRLFQLTNDGSDWTWDNEFEDFDSIAIGSNEGSYIRLHNAAAGIYNLELPVVGATVGIMNTPLPVRQEKVFGSPYLRDVTIVDRRLTFSVAVQWENAELYKAVLTGAINGLTWTAAPFQGAMDIRAISSSLIPNETNPYGIRFQAPSVVLGLQGPIALAGAESVIMQFVGVALDNAADYALITLRNGEAGYTWPA